ncbi:MAG: MGMT family protein, partial [Chloroflexi bacterium]|nr:MGMT family protein [Chloroflexota bacterium]
PCIVPCHRVVKADGHIGQYGAGGPAAKIAMLAAEGVDTDALEALADAGIRYLGDDREDIFCFPTCRRARGVAAARIVRFRAAEHALLEGYRPCPDCRPLEARAFVD